MKSHHIWNTLVNFERYFLEDLLSSEFVTDEQRAIPEKIYELLDRLDKIADMVAQTPSKLRGLIGSVVETAIQKGVSHFMIHGTPEQEKRLGEFLRKYIRTRIKYVTPNVDDPHDVFICHSSEDKEFVRTLAHDIKAEGFKVWLDEWEMQVGDSLYGKIEDALTNTRWFMVVLSASSVESKWCSKELRNAYALEDEKGKVFVLPVLFQDCKIPSLLKEKLWADCRGDKYEEGLMKILRRLK